MSSSRHLDEAAESAQQLEQHGYKQELRRTMSLSDVVVYGLIYMVPMAPVAVFGTIDSFAHGMAALVYVVAAVAMVFSAISYREMALRYPSPARSTPTSGVGSTRSSGSCPAGRSCWTTCCSRRCCRCSPRSR